jgi:hypothetical protein
LPLLLLMHCYSLKSQTNRQLHLLKTSHTAAAASPGASPC